MKKAFLSLSLVPVLLLSFATPVLAQENSGTGPDNSVPVSFRIENPFSTGDNLLTLMNKILKEIIMPIGGMLCVLAFIWAGFKFVTAQGKPGEITKAKDTLLYAAIGTAILLGATTIQLILQSTLEGVLK